MRILVWDLPVRVFHWLLVVSFAIAFLSGESDEGRYVHVFAGYVAMALVAFRVLWGFVGTRHALFRAFAASPRAAIDYLQALRTHTAPRMLTHNPVGSWAVWLLLSLIVALTLTGLLTLGGEEQQGPLAGVLSRAAGADMRELHEIVAWGGLALIAVHVLGVIMESRVHGENLVRGMIDGRKPGDAADAIPSARAGVAVALVLALLAFGAWYFRGYLTATPDKPYTPYASAALPTDPTWTEECGACHLAYHPSLLPERSWNAMLDGQADHFGEDLALEPGVIATLRAFAQAHAAEKMESEAAMKIARSIPAGEAPQRITETRYWEHKHEEVTAAEWKLPKVHGKGDCAACHADAEKATFEDAAMEIPR